MPNESDKRCKKIIEILLDHPEGMKGDDIAGRLNVSSRTIRSDIKRLQELLEVHGIKISAITNRGYKLERQDVHEVLINILPERRVPDTLPVLVLAKMVPASQASNRISPVERSRWNSPDAVMSFIIRSPVLPSE